MIFGAYTLFTRIPLHRNAAGEYATDPLWQRDLSRHFDYIADLRLCCPVIDVGQHDSKLIKITKLSDDTVRRIPINVGWGEAVRNLIPTGRAIWRALRESDIAHSGAAGWPFPESYYLLLFRPFLQFKWVVLLESSFYRMPDYGTPTFRRRLSHHINSFLVRRCLQAADARILTTERFRSLFLRTKDRSLVAPAVWVRDADLRPSAEHAARRPSAKRQTKFIFPARLVADKGVETLIDAIHLGMTRRAESGAAMPKIDIMGAGEMRPACQALAAAFPEHVRLLEPVPYGAAFFDVLLGYDALISASLQDGDQPRIFYDAFSQGLPCLASGTRANREAVTDGETGALFEAGNPAALAERLIEFAETPQRLHDMGRRALAKATAHTHEQMHRTRERFLIETMGLRDTPFVDEMPRGG